MTEISQTHKGLSMKFYSSYSDDEGNLTTLPDPRIRAITPTKEASSINNEVETLSNKLVNAINHQTNLDDTLSATRQQLAAAQKRIGSLERENQKHLDLIARGFLIRKSASDMSQAKLAANLYEERRRRIEIEDEKKNLEQELENLTAALFEEANKMVVTAREQARKEVDTIQKRNDQLKAQLADTENLLKSHQDQLAELKHLMEQIHEGQEDLTNQTSPSSPGFSKVFSKGCHTDETDIEQTISFLEPATPTHPTNLTYLLQTVLRTDLPAYYEFLSLLKLSKNNTTGKRSSTGSYSGIGASLGLATHIGHQNNIASLTPTSSSSPTPTSTVSSMITSYSTNGHNSNISLKENKFYKRVLVEDIEPTLRLDSAPGLSWLARRAVSSAVCEGTLIVEPMTQVNQGFIHPCTLCGESRDDPDYTRAHQFKPSESDSAQRYPLCIYCLGRLRSTCDFVGFLRIIRDGHWRCDDEESERSAWDECVRLREQMFWSRLGGGVIPVINYQQSDLKSPLPNKDRNYERNWHACQMVDLKNDNLHEKGISGEKINETAEMDSKSAQFPIGTVTKST